MKLPSLVLVIALAFSLTSFAEEVAAPPGAAAKDKEAPGEQIDMSEPPYWMFSYEEFHDLQQMQKDLYMEKLLPNLAKVPRLDPVSKKELEDAGEWFQSWNRIQRKVYEACQDKEMLVTCEELSDIRLEALDMLSNKKLENRKADEIEAKSKKPKKSK
ncbi:MAG: hypothetical protein J7501_01905 [Bdellovibrio sp.]|nr:hypothetical protein [Bdellovibrio sp.]